jgi:peptide/nickel transport system permease protein
VGAELTQRPDAIELETPTVSPQSRGWLGIIGRRVLAMVLILAVLTLLIFSLLYLAPGSAERALAGKRATPEQLAALRLKYHLNDPFFVQYGHWIWRAVHGDLGTSIRTGEPVSTLIVGRFGTTLTLGIYSFLIIMALGMPIGVYAALRRGSLQDRAIALLGTFTYSAPVFAVGLLLLWLFAVKLGWFPLYGNGSGFFDRLYHLTLPAIAIASGQVAYIVWLTRASLVGVLERDYITFARARGSLFGRQRGPPPPRLLVRYIVRNGLVPIVTASGLVLGSLVVGATVVEITFGVEGVGALLVQSVNFKDIAVVQGLSLIIGLLVMVANLATDLMYMVVDPRIQVR